MYLRREQLTALGLSILLIATGCDLSGSGSGGTTGAGPGPGQGPGPGTNSGNLTAPILIEVLPNPLNVAPGDEVQLIGVNFDSQLRNNQITFTAGNQRIPAVPLDVQFPTDGNNRNGLESVLRVIVPGGVSTGNVELSVNGVVAGASGYEARPQLMAFALGRNETQLWLQYNNILGFDQQASFVKLVGINFTEIEEVQFEDRQGGTARILPNTIERNPVPPGGSTTGNVPNGYSSIGFNLKDARNDVRLNFVASRRDNMKVRVVGPGGISNALEVPVHTDPPGSLARIGAVINAVKVPTGVNTGPVRIHYSMYDATADVNYTMEVYWKLVTEEDSAFRLAKPYFLDPETTETKGILPGLMGHTSVHRLLPFGGAVRTFTWDAQNDPELIRINNTLTEGALPQRHWPIELMIRPVPESSNPDAVRNTRPNHQVVTPPILYYFLEDRINNDNVAAQRVGSVNEAFGSDQNEDNRLNTALWGLPDNQDALVGRVNRLAQQFGVGTASLVLKNVDLAELEPDAVAQYFLIDTTEMQIIYRQITSDNGTPCDPEDDDLAGGGRGQQVLSFENPGRDFREFWLTTLEIADGVQVLVRGDSPLIIRLKGTNNSASEVVCRLAPGAVLDANGCPGEAGPKPTSTVSDIPGSGGDPGAGGGAGGTGATVEIAPSGLLTIIHAQDGARDGGGGGDTPAAVDGDIAQASAFPGGPGGGGGNRVAGQSGQSSVVKPNRYKPPEPGKGGRVQGEAHLLLLSPGSGGGGGGCTVTRPANQAGGFSAAIAGAGGGGGGGGIQIIANGVVEIDPSATIQVKGGKGGDGTKPTFADPALLAGATPAGGGGSGGSILVQARGEIDALCSNFDASGGLAGTSHKDTKQNTVPGAGTGGDGWIRLESSTGGAPTCSAFAASTALAGNSAVGALKLTVVSTTGFPSTGTVIVTDQTTGATLEELAYLSTTPTTFEGIPKTTVALPDGSPVFLKGAIYPLQGGVFSGDKVLPSPDTIAAGRGRDGEVHVRFEVSLDPVTGESLRDPDTGELISKWVFDTDLSVLLNPGGEVVLETSEAENDPGFLDCSRLLIDPNTILQARGSRPLRISVSGQADIGGSIDLSGSPGGILRLTSDTRTDPLPGLGGAPGAGGGPGGPGGVVEFVDGNLDNKDPENTLPVHGSAGLAPFHIPPGLDKTPAVYEDGTSADDLVNNPPEFVRPTGGLTLRGRNCGGTGQPFCTETGGGGGSSGNSGPGLNGDAVPLGDTVAGKGGSKFGIDSFRFEGDYFLAGPPGGAGGGGTPHVSAEYAGPPGILGQYRFRNGAKHAPGTGGGGGGGVLHLVAQNLTLRSSGRILARGGDAYQSIDLGGNGGAGAGGNIFIQVKNSLTIEPGAFMDVTGGQANLTPPVLPGQTLQEYPGNIRVIAGNPQVLGGKGGNGSPGRIRIEADVSSKAVLSGLNPSVSSGAFLLDTFRSLGVSKAYRLGVGPGLVATTHAMELGTPVTRYFEFGQPSGTDSVLLWQGADESLDLHGAPGAFSSLTGTAGLGGVRTPEDVAGRWFVRFVLPFLSSTATLEAQAVREVILPYQLPAPQVSE